MSAAASRRLCFSLGVWKKTPQSTSMWNGPPFFRGNVSRKQSPSPVRYIRTRADPPGLFAGPAVVVVAFFVAMAGSSDRTVEKRERLRAAVAQGIGEVGCPQRRPDVALQELALPADPILARDPLPDGVLEFQRVEVEDHRASPAEREFVLRALVPRRIDWRRDAVE